MSPGAGDQSGDISDVMSDGEDSSKSKGSPPSNSRLLALQKELTKELKVKEGTIPTAISQNFVSTMLFADLVAGGGGGGGIPGTFSGARAPQGRIFPRS